MPEEKVSLPCYADENSGVTIHRGGCGECAPAADAGPRQPEHFDTLCRYCGLTVLAHGGDHAGHVYTPRGYATVPPVPQEAAPSHMSHVTEKWKGDKWTSEEVMPSETTRLQRAVEGEHRASIETSATATDEAMRVAEQIWEGDPEWQTVEDWIQNCAALIRKAGSERERELRDVLTRLQSVLPNVAQIFDGWHNDGTAWSEWDESIRKQLGEFQEEIECLMTQK